MCRNHSNFITIKHVITLYPSTCTVTSLRHSQKRNEELHCGNHTESPQHAWLLCICPPVTSLNSTESFFKNCSKIGEWMEDKDLFYMYFWKYFLRIHSSLKKGSFIFVAMEMHECPSLVLLTSETIRATWWQGLCLSHLCFTYIYITMYSSII